MLTFGRRRAAGASSWRRSVVAGLTVLVLGGATASAAGAAPVTATGDDRSAVADAVDGGGDVADVAAAEPGASGPAAYYARLRNQNSGMCLVVRGGADGAPVVQTPCSFYRDQSWEVVYATTLGDRNYYQLRNENSGMCLAVRGTADGARAVQTRCAPFADQYWHVGPTGTTNPFHIQSAHSFHCLAVRGGADGAPAVQTGCGSWADQIWNYW